MSDNEILGVYNENESIIVSLWAVYNKGKADAIEEYKKLLLAEIERNKRIYEDKEEYWNVNESEIVFIADCLLKENK